MSYEAFKNPKQIEHLDDVMNKLCEVSSLYRCIRNKNIRKEVNDKFKELWNLIYEEKSLNLKSKQ